MSITCQDGLRPRKLEVRDKCPLRAKVARGCVGESPIEGQVSVECQDGLRPGHAWNISVTTGSGADCVSVKIFAERLEV